MQDEEIPFAAIPADAPEKSPGTSRDVPPTVLAAAERAVPLAGPISAFVGPDARVIAAGAPSPRLVRGALALVRGVAAAARDAFVADDARAGRPGSVSAMASDASDAARAEARRLLTAAVSNARSDRRHLSGLGKFVDGSIVLPAGRAEGAAPIVALTSRLTAAGIVGAFSFVLAPNDAAAWDRGFRGMAPGTAQNIQVQRPVGNAYAPPAVNPYAVQAWRERREERREERRAAMVVAGTAIAGAVLLNRGVGYGGYQQPYYQPPQPYYQPQAYPQPYAQPYAYGNGAYGNGYAPAYRPAPVLADRPAPPSDAFDLGAQSLIAVQVGSVRRAEGIYRGALAESTNCTRRLGPGADCTVRTHGITFNVARGEFIATSEGQPVMMERAGILQRFRPDILERSLHASREIVAEEQGLGARPRMAY